MLRSGVVVVLGFKNTAKRVYAGPEGGKEAFMYFNVHLFWGF